ncbi:DMT family transporter [Microvirga terricola]|uniref:DMT family transporter n=1 Tax=Microvirga terricola TaxID=2719797 RepID=A0ABX0V831_9HYPH|nr:DMT family transporter [Microvirga terricola]NIX75126.1 DMT family transporter [Microvirga terricola]
MTNQATLAAPTAPTPGVLIASLLGCSILWASGFLFVKVSGEVHPFALAAMRGLVGATSLALWFAVMRKSVLPQGREWMSWLFLGAFNGWIPNVLLAYGLTQMGTASAAMIQASAPLIVAVLSHLLFAEERLSPRRMIGVVLGFVGMAILIGPAAFPDSGISPWGVLAMVGCSISYSCANLYVRFVRQADPSRLALGQQICSGIPATILALVVVGPSSFAAVPANLAPLIALGVIATAMPILFFMRLIRNAGPTRASMVGYLMPVWTAVLAVVFLGERIGPREMIGGAVVLTGVALVSLSGRRKAASS